MVPDNRIRFPAPEIDFESDVGVTSQDHDTYPSAGQQARFDHMRIAIIGLLSQQSSYDEPSQYRDGTPWFDLNTMQLKIRMNNSWVSYAEAIVLSDGTTLDAWYESVAAGLASLAPEIVFNGSCSVNSTTNIAIPISLRDYLYSDSRAFVYKNGLLLDPRYTQIIGGIVILNGEPLDSGDFFTVIIRRVESITWYGSDVVIP
jgi:hypothetical protein